MTLPGVFEPDRFARAVDAARRHALRPTAGRLTALAILETREDRSLLLVTVVAGNLGTRLPADFEHGTVLFKSCRRTGTILAVEDPRPGQLELTVRVGGDARDIPASGAVALRPYDHLAALARWARELTGIPASVHRLLGPGVLEEPDPGSLLPSDGLFPLDDGQRMAVERSARRSMLLWGPPGTGKTHTLASAVAAMRRQDWKIVVMAISNAAVDVATLAIDDACARLGAPLRPGELIRIGTPRHPQLEEGERPHLLAFQIELAQLNRKLTSLRRSLAATVHIIRKAARSGAEPPARALAMRASLLELIHHAEDDRRRITRAYLDSASIICTTAASFVLLPAPVRADALVIDEGSQMPLAFLYHAAASDPGRLHVVGDPMQLPPIVPDVSARDRHIQPDVTALFGTSRFGLAGVDPTLPGFDAQVERLEQSGGIVTLLDQRRMAPEIGEVVNHLAYGGRLRHAVSPPPPVKAVEGLPAARLVLVTGPATGKATSCHRQAELTARIARQLARGASADETGVLVITPYRLQEKILRDLLGSVPGIRVLTIHKAQGSEAPAVVLDVPAPRNHFLDNPGEARLLWNVALSRAKRRLVLVAPQSIAANRWIGPFLSRFETVTPSI